MTAVEALKDKARRAYLRYYRAHPDATCGNALLQHISPEAAGDAREFDEAMRALEKLDPGCPEWQPLTARS